MPERSLILYNIRSAHNVGSIFRSAACAGITKLYLVGTTPAPVDRFGRMRRDIAKVALGAERSVPYESCADVFELALRVRERGVHLYALEQSPSSVPYRTVRPNGAWALMLGEEVHGIPPDVLRACDEVVEIPLFGSKESLNVSVAAGIALFSLVEQSS